MIDSQWRGSCGLGSLVEYRTQCYVQEFVVFESVTRWTDLLNSHEHMTVHNPPKQTSCPAATLSVVRLQLLVQYSSVSVALGFLHHWKMLWVKWWPGWTARLLPGQSLAVIAYKIPDSWSELASSSPWGSSAPQPLPPREKWSWWAPPAAALCRLEVCGSRRTLISFIRSPGLFQICLFWKLKDPTDIEEVSSNTWMGSPSTNGSESALGGGSKVLASQSFWMPCVGLAASKESHSRSTLCVTYLNQNLSPRFGERRSLMVIPVTTFFSYWVMLLIRHHFWEKKNQNPNQIQNTLDLRLSFHLPNLSYFLKLSWWRSHMGKNNKAAKPSSQVVFQIASGWPARSGFVWYNFRKID